MSYIVKNLINDDEYKGWIKFLLRSIILEYDNDFLKAEFTLANTYSSEGKNYVIVFTYLPPRKKRMVIEVPIFDNAFLQKDQQDIVNTCFSFLTVNNIPHKEKRIE